MLLQVIQNKIEEVNEICLQITCEAERRLTKQMLEEAIAQLDELEDLDPE